MKKALPILLVVSMIVLGTGFLFYPDISNWYNSRIHTGLVEEYHDNIARMSQEEIEDHFERAREYNNMLSGTHIVDPFVVGSGAVLPPAHYLATLNIDGVMARLEIPIIGVDLPVFHTTAMAVLDRGVGHIEGTSFPIGGDGAHSVLTGHSGLTHHRMFNDLEKLTYGDLFFITVLDYKLAYEIDSIVTVLPHEIESLRIDQSAHYVTLITCTPYGVNSHRLLVRGARVPYHPGMADEIAPIARSIDWRLVVLGSLIPIFMIIFIVFKRQDKKRRNISQYPGLSL